MATIVYYSQTDKTNKFVHKLDEGHNLIQIDESNSFTEINEPFIIIVPAYATEEVNDLYGVEALFEDLLETGDNLSYCEGVIGSGNLNFAHLYSITGKNVAKKYDLPILHEFEMMGNHLDVAKVNNIMKNIGEDVVD